MKKTKPNNFDKQYDARRYGEAEVPMTRKYYGDDAYTSKQTLSDNLSVTKPSVGANTMIGTVTSGISNVLVSMPKTFKDIQILVNSLINHQAIIVDVSKIAQESRQRILDYLNGAIYALQGSTQKIAGSIYVFAPSGAVIGNAQ